MLLKNLIIDISSNSLYFYPLWIFLFSLSTVKRKKQREKCGYSLFHRSVNRHCLFR
ncbi:hypothetical protein M068_1830 [Bacteroides fragilis str. J38-1]|nr:hypothetical protein M068_1830 [Bacteroides fragilis str. J38-1]